MIANKAQCSSSRQANRSHSAFECIICKEVLVNPRVLPCGHSFCSSPKTCLSDLLKLKTPPQCASCNLKLPVNISEDDMPKSYALSSAIEESQASSGEEGSKCPMHKNDPKFYCKPSGALISYLCWRTHNRSNLTHVTTGNGSIMANTTTEWEEIPKLPKIAMEPLSISDKPRCISMDIAQKNLYVHLGAEKQLCRYEIDGKTFVRRSQNKNIGSIIDMCVVNDQIVILRSSQEMMLEFDFLDKHRLKTIKEKTIVFPGEQTELCDNRFYMAGYADVLVVIRCQQGRENELAILRGEHLKSLARWEGEGFSSVLVISNKTIMVHDSKEIRVFQFIGENLTRMRARYITIDACDLLFTVSFKSLALCSLLDGYLFVWGRFDGSNSVKAVKVDIESVEDGAILSAIKIPGLEKKYWYLLTSSSQAVVCWNQEKLECYRLQFVR